MYPNPVNYTSKESDVNQGDPAESLRDLEDVGRRPPDFHCHRRPAFGAIYMKTSDKNLEVVLTPGGSKRLHVLHAFVCFKSCASLMKMLCPVRLTDGVPLPDDSLCVPMLFAL